MLSGKESFVGLKICEKRCDECLYSPAAIVSASKRKAILRDVERKDTFFVCHKSTINGDVVMCRGFYDANPNCGPLRVTRAMNEACGEDFIRFVDPTVG